MNTMCERVCCASLVPGISKISVTSDKESRARGINSGLTFGAGERMGRVV